MLAEALARAAFGRYPLFMSGESELMLLLGVLHALGIGLAAMLFVMFLRSDTVDPWAPPPSDDDSGGGGGGTPDSAPPTAPGGGRELPLPHAVPARVRLREAGRLADLRPRPARRPADRPHRQPIRR